MLHVKPIDPAAGDVARVCAMQPQAAQNSGNCLTPTEVKALVAAGPAFMGMDAGGEVLIAAGVIEQWQDRAVVWSVIADDLGAKMLSVHRAVARFLDALQFRRLEMLVGCEHEAGIKWAEMLGFAREGRMAKAMPEGGDAFMYGRVQ